MTYHRRIIDDELDELLNSHRPGTSPDGSPVGRSRPGTTRTLKITATLQGAGHQDASQFRI